MEVTTFDFGDIVLGTIEDDEKAVSARGVVTIGKRAMLQLGPLASGNLDRLRQLEPGFVTFIGADGLELTDRDYRAIAAAPGLRSVDFDNAPISDEQVAYFCRDGLVSLNLATVSVSDAAMAAIASVSTLEHLFISRSSVTDAGLNALEGHAAIEAVHVAGTEVTKASAPVVASWPALTTLEMPSADDEILIAAARPHSEWLHLRGGETTGRGIDALKQCAGLTRLGLRGAHVDDSACRALASLPNLRTLFLTGSTFDDVALGEGLRQLATLDGLIVNNTRAGDRLLEHLSRLPSLRAIDAMKTLVTDAGVAHLVPVATLEHADFSETAVTDAGRALLTQLPKPFVLG
ncbi:MAG: hypothetical protein Q8K63_12675 [Acidimicrobiales bacterium]|nr:hypothetical protein [Acidimicrobiales bacterium]